MIEQAADLLREKRYDGPDFYNDEGYCKHGYYIGDYTEGLRSECWAVRVTRWLQENGMEDGRPVSPMGERIGFRAPCETCEGSIWVEAEDVFDNRRKAYVCEACMPPTTDDHLNNPPF